MPTSSVARAAYGLTALCAVAGLAISLVLTISDPDSFPAADPGLFGPGDTLGRVSDWAMYFTYWSNALVAVVFGVLALAPRERGRGFRVLLLDALLMISVTGIVYAAILAPVAPPREGWEVVGNALVHYIVPPLAVLAFAAFGPRGWLERRLIPLALVIPVVWIVLTYARGAVTDAHPYGFINVVALGYPVALINTGVILLIGIALCFVLIGIDRLARRWSG
ncbi:MAG: Pr6Pr family membrane protein [Gaiellales bacterium]|jgi:hypothetical protein